MTSTMECYFEIVLWRFCSQQMEMEQIENSTEIREKYCISYEKMCEITPD